MKEMMATKLKERVMKGTLSFPNELYRAEERKTLTREPTQTVIHSSVLLTPKQSDCKRVVMAMVV